MVDFRHVSLPGVVDQQHAQLQKITTLLFDVQAAPKGWQEIRGKKSLRYLRNTLCTHPDYHVTHQLGGLAADTLADFAALHRERWAFDDIISPFQQPRRIHEYLCHPTNKVLTTLRLRGEVIAYHLGMVFGDTLLFHTPCINIKFLDQSPLQALILATVDFCEQQQLRFFDLGLGDEPYKLRYSNTSRDLFQLSFPVSFKGAALSGLARMSAQRSVATFANQVPAALRRLKQRARVQRNRLYYYECRALPQADLHQGEFQVITDYAAFVDLYRNNGLPVRRYTYTRFKEGAQYLALIDNGRLVCSGWSCQPATFVIAEVGRTIKLNEQIMLFDFVTPPPFRRQGYYTALLRHILQHFAGKTLAIYALTENNASNAAIRKVGFVQQFIMTHSSMGKFMNCLNDGKHTRSSDNDET